MENFRKIGDLDGTGGRREVGGKGRRMNTVQTIVTHICKCKMTPVETVTEIGVGG
jgi:hypothetical protein